MAEDKPLKLTDIIGTRGKYQWYLYLMSYYSSWFMGSTVLTVEFLAPMVTMHWDWDSSNPHRTVFWSNDCKMEDIMLLNKTSNVSHSQSKLVYESQYSTRTLTEELGLVCERSWLVSLANLLGLVGKCLGYMLLRVSEKFGRRPLIILVCLASSVLCLCMSFTSGYPMFAACQLLLRATTTQAHVILFMQALEMAPPTQRPLIGVVTASGPIFAQTVLVGAAWILRDWFHTQLFHTALMSAYVVSVWYVLESPVWLAVRGKHKEAKETLVKIVQRNGRNLQEEKTKIDQWLSQMKVRCELETTAEKGKVTDLFRNRTISLYTCGLTYTTLTSLFVYAGLMVNAESFGSGLYVELMLSSAFSLAVVFASSFILTKISVRNFLLYSLLFEGLACATYPFVSGFAMARTIISVVGRLFVTPIFFIGRQYMNDVFPTSVRGVGIGFCGLVANLVSSVTPFTKELGEKTNIYVPFFLFAFLSLSSALVYKMMPETRGRTMVHTVNELKQIKQGHFPAQLQTASTE